MNENELNKKWDTHKVVTEAIKSAHLESAPETRERLLALEINQTNIMEKLNEFQLDNKEQHSAIIKSLKDMENKLDTALEKKADKWVQTLMVWLGRTIGVGILATLGGIIIKAIIHFQ